MWSVVLVLVWVVGLTMLTWQEFTVAAAVVTPVVIGAARARRAMSA